MIILGVDPGTIVTGYGVIELPEISQLGNGSRVKTKNASARYRVIEYGVIESTKVSTLPARLGMIFTRLSAVFERVLPDEFAIESAFYHKNVQSTLKLGHARGVAMVCAVTREIPTGEYSPREIKRAVTGNGNASKDQVAFMVRKLLSIEREEAMLFDAYDALAVAITHAERLRTTALVERAAPQLHKARKTKKKADMWKEFVQHNPNRVRQS